MAPRVNDDLDLDGNWAAGGDADDAVPAAADGEGGRAKGKKRKRLASDADADAAVGAAAPSSAVEAAGAGSKKKAKKKLKRRAGVYSSDQLAGEGDARSRACGRVAAAWAAEGKSRKLAPLELKELVPLPDWFLPCALDVPLVGLPGKLDEQAAPRGVLAALRRSAKPPPPKARCARVVVLCLSSEQVFAELPKLAKAWGMKPLALCNFGGGRRKDQVARQGESLKAGTAVAVATPGRLLRLLDEGLVAVEGLEAVVFDLAMDRKQRDVLTLPETRRDVFTLLQRHLKKPLAAGEGPRLLLCGGPAA